MFKVGQKVELDYNGAMLPHGKYGIVVVPEDGEHTGLRLPGFKRGHSLGGALTTEDGFWVRTEYLAPYVRPSREPKLGSHIVMTRDFDNALKGMRGIIYETPERGGGTMYGGYFPSLTKGHSLSGILDGDKVSHGQWVKLDSFRVVNKPRVPKAPKAKVAEEYPSGKGVSIRTLVSVTTQDGTKTVNPGTWYGQAFNVSGRRTFLVSFGPGDVLIFDEHDSRIKLVTD